jgi:hypothetical protein
VLVIYFQVSTRNFRYRAGSSGAIEGNSGVKCISGLDQVLSGAGQAISGVGQTISGTSGIGQIISGVGQGNTDTGQAKFQVSGKEFSPRLFFNHTLGL